MSFFLNCLANVKENSQTFYSEENYFHKGKMRSYVFFLPKSKKAEYVFVGLHGRAGSGKEFFLKTEFYKVAEREGIALIFPDGFNRSWVDGRNLKVDDLSLDDKDFIINLTKDFCFKNNLMEKDRFLFGYSNGGFMTQKIAFEETDFFRAYASIVSTISSNLSKKNPIVAQNILFMNGTEDPVVPFLGGEVTGGKGKILSSANAVKIWKQKNLCTKSESNFLKDKFNDGVQIKKTDFLDCKSIKKIRIFEMIGAGHGWPGKIESELSKSFGRFSEEISANEEIFEFFMNTRDPKK